MKLKLLILKSSNNPGFVLRQEICQDLFNLVQAWEHLPPSVFERGRNSRLLTNQKNPGFRLYVDNHVFLERYDTYKWEYSAGSTDMYDFNEESGWYVLKPGRGRMMSSSTTLVFLAFLPLVENLGYVGVKCTGCENNILEIVLTFSNECFIKELEPFVSSL